MTADEEDVLYQKAIQELADAPEGVWPKEALDIATLMSRLKLIRLLKKLDLYDDPQLDR